MHASFSCDSPLCRSIWIPSGNGGLHHQQWKQLYRDVFTEYNYIKCFFCCCRNQKQFSEFDFVRIIFFFNNTEVRAKRTSDKVHRSVLLNPSLMEKETGKWDVLSQQRYRCQHLSKLGDEGDEKGKQQHVLMMLSVSIMSEELTMAPWKDRLTLLKLLLHKLVFSFPFSPQYSCSRCLV